MEAERWRRLRAAREALCEGLVSAFEGAEAPAALVEALSGVFGEASEAFGLVSGERVRVSQRGASVWVRCDDGDVEVFWDGGWRARLPGLRGQWLVALLMAWPVFRVPDGPPAPLTEAIEALRGLIYDADESVFEDIWAVVEAQVDPMVWAYVEAHIERWPRALSRAFIEHPQRRFALFGVALMRAQIKASFESVFEVSAKENPGDLSYLRASLVDAVDGACVLWNELMGTSASFSIYAGFSAVRVFDLRSPDDLGADLYWEAQGWVCTTYFDNEAVDPVEGILGMVCARYDPLAEEDWEVEEAQIQAAESVHARMYYGEGYVEDEDTAAPWLEDENWRQAFVFEGLRERPDEVDEDEEGIWTGPSDRVIDGEEIPVSGWFDDED